MITIYTMAFNEEVFLQYMIDHYRTKFPNCHIVLFDNDCTDNTIPIAKANNCEIRHYSTNNQIDDFKLRTLKNTCWKDAKTDWVLVCDIDELLDINEADLIKEESLGTTIIRSEGYNMVNMEDNFDFDNIKHGTRVTQYDKYYLFNKKNIQQINYACGCHSASPVGNIKLSNTAYKLYHYKCINPDYLVERYKLTANRLSETNKRAGMGSYYFATEEQVRAGFESGRVAALQTRIKQ